MAALKGDEGGREKQRKLNVNTARPQRAGREVEAEREGRAYSDLTVCAPQRVCHAHGGRCGRVEFRVRQCNEMWDDGDDEGFQEYRTDPKVSRPNERAANGANFQANFLFSEGRGSR